MGISKVLIAQSAPANQAPYGEVSGKFGVTIDFLPFYKIEPLTSREFRSQRINIPEYTAIVFSSRHSIDAFFAICEDLRYKVPDTMKYFCTTEAVAVYLQKHIVFRKRKIFYGSGTPQSVLALVTAKHKGEKFLITTTAGGHGDVMSRLFESAGLDATVAAFVKAVSQDIKSCNIASYDLIVMCNPADLLSLKENFPQLDLKEKVIVTFGRHIVQVLEAEGVRIAVQAPTPEVPSIAKALETYLSSQ